MIQGASASQPTPPAGGSAAARSRTADQGGVPFRALLDEIERSAARLSQESRKDLSRESLSGAVDQARSSLEQVLSLKERLLEEWRAAQQRPR